MGGGRGGHRQFSLNDGISSLSSHQAHTDTLIGRSFFPPTSSSLLINREVLAEYMGQIFNLYITFTILYIVKGEDE
jgi:hypothetical protein